MEKRWIVRPVSNSKEVDELAGALNIDKFISRLLVQRGIKTFEQARVFFRPKLSDLHDPFLMKDMMDAVERLDWAISQNEKILIYGDYDVDGTTAVAIVYSFLKKRFFNVGYYIPDRYHEGYGISYKSIDFASGEGYSLIIALDCGIKANEKVVYAKKKGIDFIICDHHNPGEEIPGAVAVLDPKRPDCKYPFKELSGCGVGFKLLQAYSIKNNIPENEVFDYLDLVTVSIASDIVPINGENRILSYYGLEKINKKPSVGLSAIMKIAGVPKEICINDIVFKIGPRINAAGRIDSGCIAVDLLIENNEEKANEIAGEINKFNTDRQNLDKNITLEAINTIDQSEELKLMKTTVLFNSQWHKGVLGIVASRLIEYYYRPTVILTESNGLITGSARSVQGFDLYKAIESCSDLLENFGGHMFAAGLTMKPDNLDKFRQRFESFVAENISDDQLVPQIEIDAVIKLKDITSKFHNLLKQFQPFGPENMRPVFMTENVFDSGTSRVVGKECEHLKLDLIQEDDPFNAFSAIAFGQAKFFPTINEKKPVSVCYSIEENDFQGKVTLQLRIKDIKA